MNSLSIEEASEAVAAASAKFEAFKAQKKVSEKRKGKKSTPKPSSEHGSELMQVSHLRYLRYPLCVTRISENLSSLARKTRNKRSDTSGISNC